MARKKKTATTAPDPATAPTLEEQVDVVLALEPWVPIAARLKKVGELIASCDAAGIEVPQAVRDSLPTHEEIVAEYKRKAQLATAAKNEQEYLRDHLLASTDAAYVTDPTGDHETLLGEGFSLVRTPGFHETVSKTLLVQLGVDPDVIDRATVVTPYFYWAIKEPKAAKGPAES